MYLIEANVKQTTCLLVCTCRSGFKKQVILLNTYRQTLLVVFLECANNIVSK